MWQTGRAACATAMLVEAARNSRLLATLVGAIDHAEGTLRLAVFGEKLVGVVMVQVKCETEKTERKGVTENFGQWSGQFLEMVDGKVVGVGGVGAGNSRGSPPRGATGAPSATPQTL
jgi:hypothetical protein